MSQWPENWDCERVREHIEVFLDGELASVEQVRFKAHLDDCLECATQLHLANEIQGELQALPEFDTPAPVLQQILDQTVRQQGPERSPSRLWQLWPRPAWVALAAGVLALIVGVAVLDQPAPDSAQPDTAAIAQATAKARYALAKTGLLTRKAGKTIRDRTLRDQIAVPTSRGLSLALGAPAAGAEKAVQEGVNDV